MIVRWIPPLMMALLAGCDGNNNAVFIDNLEDGVIEIYEPGETIPWEIRWSEDNKQWEYRRAKSSKEWQPLYLGEEGAGDLATVKFLSD